MVITMVKSESFFGAVRLGNVEQCFPYLDCNEEASNNAVLTPGDRSKEC